MKLDETLKLIGTSIKNRFNIEASHDIWHLKRVTNTALHIQKKEGGDKEVVAVASMLHDVHRIIQKDTGKFCSPKESLPVVQEILDEVGVDKNRQKQILHCIEFHEEYEFSSTGKTVFDIETLILQDADNLDAMGAIGIGRAFTYSGVYNIPMYNPDIPINRESYDENTKNDLTTIHHFYSKLLKLKNNMNTKTGKKLAKARHEFMIKFLDEFFDEWEGKR